MDLLALGNRIHEARKQKGITSNHLAELCGVGPVHIRKMEAGSKAPSIETFVRLCNALETSPQYLLQDSLEANDLTAQTRVTNKILSLSKAQADMVYGIIDTVIAHDG